MSLCRNREKERDRERERENKEMGSRFHQEERKTMVNIDRGIPRQENGTCQQT